MATTIHTYTDPNGVDHTRTSKTKTYAYCVVMVLDREAELARAAADVARSDARFRNPITEQDTRYQAEAAVRATRERNLRLAVENHDRVSAQPATYYSVLSWSSRRDLAAKAADREAGWVAREGHRLIVEPVTTVVTKGGAR